MSAMRNDERKNGNRRPEMKLMLEVRVDFGVIRPW